MSELHRRSRELLESAKDFGEPDDETLARVRTSLLRRVGLSAAAGALGATTAVSIARAAPLPLAKAISAGAATLSAKVLGVVLLGAVGVSGVYAYHARDVTPAPAHAVVVPRARISAPEAPVRIAPEMPRPPDVTGPSPVPHTAEKRVVVKAGSDDARSVGPAHPSSLPTPLATDIAHLRDAQAAVVANDWRRARDEAGQVHAEGPLAEEREGIRVLAACALTEAGAADAADTFARHWPSSPLVSRIRVACTTP